MLAVCWFVILLLSNVVYLPMGTYDLLAYVCCGNLGISVVVVVLSVFATLNWRFQWWSYGVYVSCEVLIVGVLKQA
ncbi:hypothetical protein PHMEG_00035345 [Phytophthora megakarya]|uniref:Transmembrane protein n=1 Tax=Phytophthora megakarya TaxID=4795 RepID=A0A225UNJ7_9STRA|nr:hypothetical protein PHMEG_00035345 [Phytophthora megakarya]